MGYELSIIRDGYYDRVSGSAISADEWRAAVLSVANLRLSDGSPVTTINPKTSERITIGLRDTDAQILFPDHARLGDTGDSWISVFFYQPRGRVTFRPSSETDNPLDPVRCAAVALARALEAHIEGEDGQRFDW